MIQGFLVLADSATTDQTTGKVHMLGAGWSLTGPVVPPSAVAGFLRVPWDEVEGQVQFRLLLVDENREGVKVLHDDGENRAIGSEGVISLLNARPTDEIAKGMPLNLSFAVSVPPLPLPGGHTYEWILEIGDSEVASVSFGVRSVEA
ncbi:hypothetical protein [Nonomuraea sp. NPDC001023]|uniref:DUF6941 family protein n=1 Tax=unclassified Nonomuraea TaxID=2593643 RepID=UPI003321C5FF